MRGSLLKIRDLQRSRSVAQLLTALSWKISLLAVAHCCSIDRHGTGSKNGSSEGSKMQLTKRGGVYHVWFSLRGKKTSRSTGKSNLRAAEARGREIIEAAREQRWEALEKTKARKTDVSFAKIEEIYRSVATCRHTTMTGNIAALRHFCRHGIGKPIGDCRLREVSIDTLLRYRAYVVSRGSSPERGEISARTKLRQFGSVFARHLLSSYPPEVKDAIPAILARLPGRVGVGSHPGFIPIPPRTLRAIYRDMITLRKSQPAAWRFFLLMARCGLSNREAHNARGTWLREGAIHVPARDGKFVPKSKNRVRSIPIRPDRYRRWFSELEGKNVRVCTNSLWLQRAVLSPMLRRHLPDRQKGLYELRKHAGSLVATRDGIYAAAQFLGDRVETAERFYATLLKPLRPL
jgi:hypothetical protein